MLSATAGELMERRILSFETFDGFAWNGDIGTSIDRVDPALSREQLALYEHADNPIGGSK